MMNTSFKATAATLLAATFLVSAVRAQDAPAAALDSAAKNPDAGAFYIPYGNLKNASPEQVNEARKAGESVAADLMQAYERRAPQPDLAAQMGRAKKNADDIADQQLSGQRDQVLEFLGINPKRASNLYYFVSWSMPLEMLRSYAVEAMWSGGTLVFRGTPPGKGLGPFMSEDLSKLAYGKGAAANISIDPRLFDAYEVTSVPSLVLTTYRKEMQCTGIAPTKFRYRGADLQYNTCPPLDPAKYSKIAGAITANYALQQFADDGMKEALPYKAALARGFALGELPDKAQKAFTGKWEDLKSPSQRMKEEQGIRDARKAAEVLSTSSPVPTLQ